MVSGAIVDAVLKHEHPPAVEDGERRRRGRGPGRFLPTRGGDAEHLVLPHRGDVPERVRRRVGPLTVVRRCGVLWCGDDDLDSGAGGRIHHADGPPAPTRQTRTVSEEGEKGKRGKMGDGKKGKTGKNGK